MYPLLFMFSNPISDTFNKYKTISSICSCLCCLIILMGMFSGGG